MRDWESDRPVRLVTRRPQTLRSFRSFARSGGVGCVRLWRLRSFFFRHGAGGWGLQSRDARDGKRRQGERFWCFQVLAGSLGWWSMGIGRSHRRDIPARVFSLPFRCLTLRLILNGRTLLAAFGPTGGRVRYTKRHCPWPWSLI